MLPSELWGKDESYLWYCLGKQEPTLQLRYLRASFDDKPYTVCHYENVKIRASMAELMANGGAPMAKYINFTDPGPHGRNSSATTSSSSATTTYSGPTGRTAKRCFSTPAARTIRAS